MQTQPSDMQTPSRKNPHAHWQALSEAALMLRQISSKLRQAAQDIPGDTLTQKSQALAAVAQLESSCDSLSRLLLRYTARSLMADLPTSDAKLPAKPAEPGAELRKKPELTPGKKKIGRPRKVAQK